MKKTQYYPRTILPHIVKTGLHPASDHVHDQAQYYVPGQQKVQQLKANHLINKIQALYELPTNIASSYISAEPLASWAFLETELDLYD